MQSLSYAQSTVWGIPQSERQVGIMQEDRGSIFTYLQDKNIYLG